jgi:hypothetical protein
MTCTDCRAPIPRGEATVAAPGEPLCAPCAELRRLAFEAIERRRGQGGGVRRGPRYLVPPEAAARIFMHGGDGTASGPLEPVLEVSRHGFRVAAARRFEVGERLSCHARLPGAPGAPIEFDVSVRWCRRERDDRFEIGVEAADPQAGYGDVYQAIVAAIHAPG